MSEPRGRMPQAHRELEARWRQRARAHPREKPLALISYRARRADATFETAEGLVHEAEAST